MRGEAEDTLIAPHDALIAALPLDSPNLSALVVLASYPSKAECLLKLFVEYPAGAVGASCACNVHGWRLMSPQPFDVIPDSSPG